MEPRLGRVKSSFFKFPSFWQSKNLKFETLFKGQTFGHAKASPSEGSREEGLPILFV